MKALLSTKVRRGKVIAEWEPASHHLTDEGRDAFRARQLARIADAEAQRKEVAVKVRQIKRGKA